MPDMWIDVDAAVTVPVNLVPLIDDTDFITRETGIVYNQAGMDLVWNFVSSLGVITQTAVTPTTGGDYDWTHSGDAMYKIEIPASGGASINNDAEGYGWFSGICTGVLAWRGPVMGFRAAGLNNLLCDSAYDATRGLAGTALPGAAADAAGGLPISDAGGYDIDNIAKYVWDRIISKANHNIGQSAGKKLRELSVLIAAEGAVSGTPTTTTFTTNITGYDDNFFKDMVISAYNGAAMAGQGRVISSYTGSTGVFVVDEAFTSALDSGDDVVVFAPHVHTVTSLVAAVWAAAARTLTSGANIALTKGAGLLGLNDLSASDVNDQVDLALDTAIPGSPTAGSLNEVMANQARSAATIKKGAAAAGTLSTTEMTTDLTIFVADQLNGRILIFAEDTVTPALRGQATDITGTTVSGGKLTFTAITTAPVNGDTFVVV